MGINRGVVEKQYFECECGCVVLTVAVDDWDEYTTFVWLTIYGEHHAGWKDRLRHIWSIIRDGHPWGSQELMFRLDEADRLGRILIAAGEEAIGG